MSQRHSAQHTFPDEIPIFPLVGVLLLPGGRLPLNIFEPRYLNMIDDALGTQDRLIGIIQPSSPDDDAHTPALFTTGCAGRIIAFAEEGERYLITLEGVRRFDLVDDQTIDRLYRRATVDWGRYVADLDHEQAKIDRNRLISAIKAYFVQQEIAVDWNAIDAVPDGKLVTTVAMVCPFQPTEKQALLQARGMEERAKVLIGLVEAAFRPTSDTIRH